MALQVDYGRRLVRTDGVPCVVEVIATRADDTRPARCGYRPGEEYQSPITGRMRRWSRSWPIVPETGQA